MKKIILSVLIFLICSLNALALEDNYLPSVTGVVKNVVYSNVDENETIQAKQLAEIKILDGEHKGEIVRLENVLTGNPAYDIKLRNGVNVVLHAELVGNDVEYSISDIKRSRVLTWLSFIFCGLLLFVGKRKGLFSLIAIVLTCLLIFYALSPLILLGLNPVIATILLCIASTALTMYLVGGVNRKSSSAVIGTVLSLIFAGLLSIIAFKLASLN